MRFGFTDYDPKVHDNDPVTLARYALIQCQRDGTIADHVTFKRLESSRAPRQGVLSVEIQLQGRLRDRGRRAGNSGSYGSGSGYAATYDEWGFFISKLFRLTREEYSAIKGGFFVGSRTYPTYSGEVNFHHLTGHTYEETYPGYVEIHGDEYPYRSGRNQIGRRGYGRVHYDAPAVHVRYATEDPRTAEWLRAFHRGEVF